MRILQIHNKLPYPPKDGGAIAIWNLTKELDIQGRDITLLCMNTLKHYYPVKSIPDKEKGNIKIVSVDVDAPIRFYSAVSNLIFSRLPYNAARFINSDFKNKLKELLTTQTYDIVLLEGLYVAPYISLIRKYSKAKIALRTHNVEHEIWQRIRMNETQFLKNKYLQILVSRLKRFEKQLIQHTDLIIPITERDASVFRTMGSNKPSHVCPAAINLTELFPQPKKIEYPTLFFIGALDWAPNQEGLVWFFDNLWNKVMECNKNKIPLFIAGRNCPAWLEKLIHQQKDVHYLGEIENAYEFMNTKAVMIAPIFSGSGMRVKIVEGMALGKVIVTTPIGTEGIDTTHNKNILIANTADEFCELIKKSCENRAFFDMISRNAMEFVRQNYDIKAITKSLVKFFEIHIQ